MTGIVVYFKDWYENAIGWFQLLSHRENKYKCKIDSIENAKPATIIHYKIIGCRNIQRDTAANLNKSHVFSLFRPDHAQIIISIAAVESCLGLSPESVQEKLQKYVAYCSAKIDPG